LIPGSGISPGEGNGNPLQYSCPGTEEPSWLQSMGLQKSQNGYHQKDLQIKSAGEERRKGNQVYHWWECKLVQPLFLKIHAL